MNGGIFKSPDEKYLLGLMIIELRPEHKDNYPLITTNEDTTKQIGLTYSSARKGDLIYGIGFKGKDVTLDNAILKDNQWEEKMMKNFFPFEGQETFIDIPKKSKGMVYVILIAVIVFLYFKFRK